MNFLNFKQWMNLQEASGTTRRKQSFFLPPHAGDYANKSGSAKDLIDYTIKLKKSEEAGYPLINVDYSQIEKTPVWSPEAKMPPSADNHEGQKVLPIEDDEPWMVMKSIEKKLRK